MSHIEDLLSKIDGSVYSKNEKSNLTLKMVAVFHDIIYYPWNIKVDGNNYTLGKSNEELSADYFNVVWNKMG